MGDMGIHSISATAACCGNPLHAGDGVPLSHFVSKLLILFAHCPAAYPQAAERRRNA